MTSISWLEKWISPNLWPYLIYHSIYVHIYLSIAISIWNIIKEAIEIIFSCERSWECEQQRKSNENDFQLMHFYPWGWFHVHETCAKAQCLWALGIILCYHYLDILSDFTFEFVYKWSTRNSGICMWAEIVQCACPLFLRSLSHTAFTIPHGNRILVHKWGMGVQQNSCTQYACYIFQWANPGADSPRDPIFILIRTCFEHGKSAMVLTKKLYHILSYSCYFSVWANHLHWK